MSLTLGLDVLIVVLLFVAIIYAIMLDHHLSSTKENHRALSCLIEQFYQSAKKTQEDMVLLKNTQEQLRQALEKENERAVNLKGDLINLLDAIDKKTVLNASYQWENGLFEREEKSSYSDVTPEISQSEEELLFMLKELK